MRILCLTLNQLHREQNESMANNKTKGRVEENIGKVEVNSIQGRMGFNKGWSIEGKNGEEGLIFGERERKKIEEW